MKIPVRLVNPGDTSRAVEVLASCDFSRRVTVIPRQLADELDLPEFVRIERWNDVTTFCSIESPEEAEEVTLGLGALTSLLLERDEVSGELREFEPTLL